jgi:hypothetical protein
MCHPSQSARQGALLSRDYLRVLIGLDGLLHVLFIQNQYPVNHLTCLRNRPRVASFVGYLQSLPYQPTASAQLTPRQWKAVVTLNFAQIQCIDHATLEVVDDYFGIPLLRLVYQTMGPQAAATLIVQTGWNMNITSLAPLINFTTTDYLFTAAVRLDQIILVQQLYPNITGNKRSEALTDACRHGCLAVVTYLVNQGVGATWGFVEQMRLVQAIQRSSSPGRDAVMHFILMEQSRVCINIPPYYRLRCVAELCIADSSGSGHVLLPCLLQHPGAYNYRGIRETMALALLSSHALDATEAVIQYLQLIDQWQLLPTPNSNSSSGIQTIIPLLIQPKERNKQLLRYVASNHLSTVQLLLECGAITEQALVMAVSQGNRSIIKLLIEWGTPIDQTLYIAIEQQQTPMVILLLSQYPRALPPTALRFAVVSGNLEILTILLQAGIRHPDALWLAYIQKSTAMFSAILAVDQSGVDHVLRCAIMNDHSDMQQAILRHGQPDAHDAMNLAIRIDCLDAVTRLTAWCERSSQFLANASSRRMSTLLRECFDYTEQDITHAQQLEPTPMNRWLFPDVDTIA